MKRRFELIVKEEIDELNREKLNEGVLGDLGKAALSYAMNNGVINAPRGFKNFWNQNVSNFGETARNKIIRELNRGEIGNFKNYTNTNLHVTIIHWDRDHSNLANLSKTWKQIKGETDKPLRMIAKTNDGMNYSDSFGNQGEFLTKCIDRIDSGCLTMTVPTTVQAISRVSFMAGGINGINAVRDVDAGGVENFIIELAETAKPTSTIKKTQPPPLPSTTPPPLSSAAGSDEIGADGLPGSISRTESDEHVDRDGSIINEGIVGDFLSKMNLGDAFAAYIPETDLATAIQKHDRDLYTFNVSRIIAATNIIQRFIGAVDMVLGENVTSSGTEGAPPVSSGSSPSPSGSPTPSTPTAPSASSAPTPNIGNMPSSSGAPTSINDYAAAAQTNEQPTSSDIGAMIDNVINNLRGDGIASMYLQKVKQICKNKDDLVKLKKNLSVINPDMVGSDSGADMLSKLLGIPKPPMHPVTNTSVQKVFDKAGTISRDVAFIPYEYLEYLPETEGERAKQELLADKSLGNSAINGIRRLGNRFAKSINFAGTDVGEYTN